MRQIAPLELEAVPNFAEKASEIEKPLDLACSE